MQLSNTEVKTLYNQGAIKVNGEVKKEWKLMAKSGDVVQIGPKKVIKIK